MQVNIGMQFVKAGQYSQAIRFLEAVIQKYRLDPVDEFCAGQIAIGEVLGLYYNYDAQLGICAQVTYRLMYVASRVKSASFQHFACPEHRCVRRPCWCPTKHAGLGAHYCNSRQTAEAR